MKLNPVYKGKDLTAHAVETDDGECPFETYLRALNESAPAHADSLVATIKYLCNNRAYRNPDKIDQIAGHENVWEFTLRSGVRVLFGYAPGGTLILSYGFWKGDTTKPIYEKAEALHATVSNCLQGKPGKKESNSGNRRRQGRRTIRRGRK